MLFWLGDLTLRRADPVGKQDEVTGDGALWREGAIDLSRLNAGISKQRASPRFHPLVYKRGDRRDMFKRVHKLTIV
jgi:hypothetical protein